ncbi:MAG TPA: hypothetical protein VN754_04610, partial [Candidatus Binataceae bacterium]|nr:hypothetical protein [Candidatus Binataceae bacterium]
MLGKLPPAGISPAQQPIEAESFCGDISGSQRSAMFRIRALIFALVAGVFLLAAGIRLATPSITPQLQDPRTMVRLPGHVLPALARATLIRS